MFDLCLALGRWDVDGVADEMPQRLFYEWQAYARLNPFGQARDSLHAGIVAAVIANVHRGKKRGPYSAQDFVPEFRPRRTERKTSTQLWRELKLGLELGYGLKRIEKPS